MANIDDQCADINPRPFKTGDRVSMRYGVATVVAIGDNYIGVRADRGGFWLCATNDSYIPSFPFWLDIARKLDE